MDQINQITHDLNSTITKMFHRLTDYFPVILAALVTTVLLFVLWIIVQHIKVYVMSRHMNIIQFILPKDNENEPHQMNLGVKSLWISLPWYFRIFMTQPYYSFEIHSKENEITFNIVVPMKLNETVEKTIHSVYKDAESRIFPVGSEQDYMRFYKWGKRSVGRVLLDRHYIFSLQTFKDWTQDPLSTITSSMTKLTEGQQITLQVMCRPLQDFPWRFFGRIMLDRYEATGKVPKQQKLLWKIFRTVLLFPFKFIGFIISQIFFTSRYVDGKKSKKKDSITLKEEGMLGQVELKEHKSISGKITQHGFKVSIRVICGGGYNRTDRMRAVRDVSTSLQQLDAENKLVRKHIMFMPWLDNWIVRRRYLPLFFRQQIISADELASIFHLPNKDVLTPGIKRIKSKQAPPPLEASREENLFGESRYRGVVEKIGIRERDLDKSVYLLGKQGTGKSEVLENLILQQIKNDTSATLVLDPAGQMARNIIGRIPPEQIDNVLYLNLGDYEYPPSINVLDQTKFRGINTSLLKEQLVGILKKEFMDSWGPSTEDILRNAVELALVSDGSSILEVMLAIVSDDFRREYLDRLDNYVVKGYWRNEFEQLDPRFRTSATNAPLNKLRRIAGDLLARNILCQRYSTVDFSELFNSKKHVIVNLAKGTLGEENSRFLGSLLISYVYLLMQEREYTIPNEKDRTKLTLFVDELQNYVTETVADMLAELRKFGFRMVAGHQFRSQFEDEKTKTGIYQLSRTKIFFNIGEDDAKYVAETVSPRFTANDLTSLENFQIIVKMMIDGYEHPPFTLFTLPNQFAYSDEVASQIIERSRKLSFSGQAALDEIKQRYNRFIPDNDDHQIRTVNLAKPAADESAAPSQPVIEKQPETMAGKIKLTNAPVDETPAEQEVQIHAETSDVDAPAAKQRKKRVVDSTTVETAAATPKKSKRTASHKKPPADESLPQSVEDKPVDEPVEPIVEAAAAAIEQKESIVPTTSELESNQDASAGPEEQDFGIKIKGFGFLSQTEREVE